VNAAPPLRPDQAHGLVRRARCGDQQAMALIAATHQAAQDPTNARARDSLKLILKTTSDHPVPANTPAFPAAGEEDRELFALLGPETVLHLGVLKWAAPGDGSSDEADAACLRTLGQALLCALASGLPRREPVEPVAVVLLAQGAPLSATRLSALIDECAPAGRDALRQSLVDGGDTVRRSPRDPFARAGRVIAGARAIQLQRVPGQPIAAYSPAMGAELGETCVAPGFGVDMIGALRVVGKAAVEVAKKTPWLNLGIFSWSVFGEPKGAR
jgi:hypothetical protein